MARKGPMDPFSAYESKLTMLGAISHEMHASWLCHGSVKRKVFFFLGPLNELR